MTRPPRRRAAAALLLAAALAGCGGGGGDDPDRAKDAIGAVTLCGRERDVEAARPALRAFNAERPKVQASSIAFPDAGDRFDRAVIERARRRSAECDVLAVPAAQAVGLASRGWLFDLERYAREREKVASFAAVRSPAGKVVGVLRNATGAGRPALVVAAASRNPDAALALLDALSGGRTTAPDDAGA
ncbi:hypothetical protein [Patulibacter sp. SYSU D01012]|uniref:hypothetical protein n=1 Tax=Patulibacter sp. SYSU D01012 TaxID=2817381 RepID=UPI001B30FEDA|nr:hypothetical protein [Patulibacter sp. SYSU D01012]